MIIINEYTEKALTERLETIRQEAKPERCAHFRFSKTKLASNSATQIIQHYIESNVETTEQNQLFTCEDGDAYLIGHSIASKDMQGLISHLGKNLGLDMDSIATIYELPAKIYPVLTSVDEKIQLLSEEKQEEIDSAISEQEVKNKNAILSVVDEEIAKASIINTRENRDKPQIMVIEDDAFTRQLVTNIMKKQYPIEGTGSPMEMLQMYVRLAPDVLFLDINLPDITGHEILERILELDPDAYVVMLSGNADKENIISAMSKGAKGFVGKPFTKEKLLQYIDKRLAQ